MTISDNVSRMFRAPSPSRQAAPAIAVPGQGVPVTAAEVLGLRDEGVLVLDVREPREWLAGHIPGSRNIPLDVIAPALVPAGFPVVLVCANGHRARLAARIMHSLGMADGEVFVLAPGLARWPVDTAPLLDRDEMAGRVL